MVSAGTGAVKAGIGLAGRVIWVVALILVGLLATGLQMDRQARDDVALAHKVPDIARAYALDALARDAYASGDIEQGLTYSRSLVLRRPVPAENLALLANGLWQSRQMDQAVAALLLSAQRGWRDPFTQAMMVDLALQADDPQVAAQRTLALWRVSSTMPATKFLTGQLLRAPGGLKAFTDGMIQRDRWGTTLLLWAIGARVPLTQMEALSQTIAARHMPLSCPQLLLPLRKQARIGNAASAGRMWSQLCGQPSDRSSADFTFGDASANGLFDWRYPGQAGLSRDVVKAGGEARLQFRNDEFTRVTLAARMAALGPGTHTIRAAGEYSEAGLVFAISCFDAEGNGKSVFNGAPAGGIVKFTTPHSCRGQEITIQAGHGEGSVGPLRIE